MKLQTRAKKKLLETGICVLFLITGCSGNVALEDVISENETTEGAVSENTVSENIILDNTISEDAVSENTVLENNVLDSTISEDAVSENKPVFVSWEDAGLEDHVMEWGDQTLRFHMECITNIHDRDIMLSDVWEYTELNMNFGGEHGEHDEYTAEDGTIYAIGSYIQCIDALGELKNLQVLDLGGQAAIDDISVLSSLTNLRELYLWHIEGWGECDLSDLSALSGLTNLEILDLSCNVRIGDLSALSSLTNLRKLDLAGHRYISDSDLSALSNLTNLEKLNLRCDGRNGICDISALSGLTNLRELNLEDNQISDLSALSGMKNLEILRLKDNEISDISILSGMVNLRVLDLNNNEISDLSALSGLINLEQLLHGEILFKMIRTHGISRGG